MKKQIVSFTAGAMAALLISSTAVTALAANGTLAIEVTPVNALVNGELFHPKDAMGNDVMVFSYNGTTYAPLRALAEAYGLEVGYDAERQLATVSKPMTKGQAPATGTDYASFERCWTVTEKPVSNYGSEKVFTINYSGNLSMSEFKVWWKSFDSATVREYAERLAAEVQRTVPGNVVTAYFSYGQYPLGSVHAESTHTGSNFDAAGVWIK